MKRLVTERDVARLAPGSRLEMDRDTLITPAARDLAFVRQIEIVEPSTTKAPCTCAGCRAGTTCECEPAWPKLADGDYHLEVRGGKVRSRRVGPGRGTG